jgi:hypothetical protein
MTPFEFWKAISFVEGYLASGRVSHLVGASSSACSGLPIRLALRDLNSGRNFCFSEGHFDLCGIVSVRGCLFCLGISRYEFQAAFLFFGDVGLVSNECLR